MANTGNTQQQINYGAAANDGQGDPLRTAFIKTDDNFDNVWLAGPVGSNITIGNNTIQSNNTNGNIILRPNGTGIVQANASIIPNADGVRDLGSSTQAWRRAYIDQLLFTDLTVTGDATIGGNLTVQGDTIQIGNITTDTLTIQLANTAANAASANGAGITVGANDNIATFRYTSGANRWNTNIGLNVTGGFSADSAGNVWSINNDFLSFPSGASWRSDRFTLDEYIQSATDGYLNLQTYDNTSNVATEFHMEHGIVQLNIYNGNNVTWEFDSTGNLTLPGNTFAVNYANGIAVSLGGGYGNANVVANLAALASNPISTTGNISGNYFIGNGSQLTGLAATYGNANVAANLAAFANNPISTTGTVNTGNIIATGSFTANSAGNVWNISNDFLSFPSGASWRSDKFTLDEYIQSAVDGYLNLQTYDNTSNVATELHMEHGVVQFNIYNGTLKTWNFNEDGSTTFPGDLLPSANLGGNLGNSSLYWSNLWVANNTIYIGGVPLGMTSGNVLTVNGNAVLSNNSSTAITTTGNITSGNVLTGGRVSATGNVTANYFIGNGSQLTGLSTSSISNGNSNVAIATANGNVTITAAGVNTWTFGTNGNLTLPNGAVIRDTAGDAVAFGQGAGQTSQGSNSVAVGREAGNTNQSTDSVAIGTSAGANSQDRHNVAIGTEAGMNNQGEDSVAIGWLAGRDDQTRFSIAIGWNAGSNTQGQLAQAYGRDAGAYYQQSGALAMGYGAGRYLQKQEAIAIGSNAGYGSPQSGTVASMPSPDVVRIFGSTSTLYNGMTVVGGSIAPTTGITIVGLSGEDITLSSVPATPLTNGTNLNFYSAQGPGGVAIGSSAAQALQGQNAVAVGYRAGQTTQGTAAVAMGFRAGETTQGNSSVALGEEAGLTGQGQNSIAIGRSAGQSSQGNAAIAMGWAAAQTTQGTAAVAIGEDAGRYYQGEYSVAIGYQAGYNGQGNNSIVLNATGNQINGITANSFTVTPVRNDVANVDQVMFYNTTSKEITYGNVISVAGNISGGNILTGGQISATGNISAVGNVTAGNISAGSGTINGGNVNGANFNGNVAFGTGTVGGSGNITGGNISAIGNISGGNLSLSGNITSSIGFTGATIAINNAPGGNEGAEIQWALPSAANTVLTTSLIQDVYQNGMRFFEAGGNNRGLYMDLGNVPNGSTTAVGYRDIPQVSFTGNATLAATDAGRHYYSTLATANTLTIANNTSVSWSVGTAITVVNRGSGNITIAQGSGVSLYLAGNSSAGNRTIATYGMATLLNVAANVWMINGSQVT